MLLEPRGRRLDSARKNHCPATGLGKKETVESQTSALHMSPLQVGLRLPKEEVLSRLRHAAPDRLRHALRHRAHRAPELLDVGTFEGNMGLHP